VLACNPAALARDLAREAFAASVDKKRSTPYAWSASEEFNLVFNGGKVCTYALSLVLVVLNI
jgi:hypothetical protein